MFYLNLFELNVATTQCTLNDIMISYKFQALLKKKKCTKKVHKQCTVNKFSTLGVLKELQNLDVWLQVMLIKWNQNSTPDVY